MIAQHKYGRHITGVAIAVRVGLPVFLPEQLLGQVSIQLPLPVKLGEVWHRQHGRSSAWRTAEQGSFQPVFVPILAKRPCNSGSFGSLQILVDGSVSGVNYFFRSATIIFPVGKINCRRTVPRPIEQLRAICLSPRPTENFSRRTSLILRTDNLLAGKLILPFEGRLPAIVLSSATTCRWKSFRRSRTQFRDRPETVRLHPGTSVHLHPGILFGITPEHRSESSRNRVHLTPESPQRVWWPLNTEYSRQGRRRLTTVFDRRYLPYGVGVMENKTQTSEDTAQRRRQ
jgi:hypothetical protein